MLFWKCHAEKLSVVARLDERTKNCACARKYSILVINNYH